ncbi:hypothetical protein MA16_Dca009211 [Dendrobium catenatum]|uniref:Uncharacterized protein n=1 Tax=Dendrobium catenatum TaxID=906689 RepID=A0A2I0VR49_9ASPA|nr:hypothetical protein MA16_Dca009211 [Dendrobium catenatum]
MASKRLDPGFLEDKHSKSFKDVLSGFDASDSFPDFRISTIRDILALSFSEDEFLHLAKPFCVCFGGEIFPLKRPNLDSIRMFFFNLKLSSEFSVIAVGHKKSECTKLFPHLRPSVVSAPSPVDVVSKPLVTSVNPVISSNPIVNSNPLDEFNEVNGVVPLALGPLNCDDVINIVDEVVVPAVESPFCPPIAVESPIMLATFNGLGDAVLPGCEVWGSAPLISPARVNLRNGVNCFVVAGIVEAAAPSPGAEISGLQAITSDNNVVCVLVDNLERNSVCSNNFVDVPVNLVDKHTMVNHLGDNSDFDIRNHVDWLHGSSEFESESDCSDCGLISLNFCGGSDPENNFSMAHERPVVSVASRGRFRGRGRRRR